MGENTAIIYKELGETPLEALESYRAMHPELKDMPMTYAGRLDPMAEGELLILIGDECKNKERYLRLDKEYEVEVVFGISTDTYDALGIAILRQNLSQKLENETNIVPKPICSGNALQRYVGEFVQEYPAYSSKTVGGKQLHELARSDDLPDEMPTKEVEIYSIESLDRRMIKADELKKTILTKIALVRGDFRQKEIVRRWEEVSKDPIEAFNVLRIRVKCSSGTYMRSLADRMGQDAGMGAFALSIKRTKIILEHKSLQSNHRYGSVCLA